MAATVGGYSAIAVRGEEKHLVFKGIGDQRPAVTEDDRLPRAPVLVIDLGAVTCGEDSCPDSAPLCRTVAAWAWLALPDR